MSQNNDVGRSLSISRDVEYLALAADSRLPGTLDFCDAASNQHQLERHKWTPFEQFANH